MRQTILEGACQGTQGTTNLARVSEVTLKLDELPRQFYDWLCNAYHQYIPFDPEAPENWSMINTAFVQQSASDVHQKLQKMEGFSNSLTNSLV
jgi:hypothetical protein